MKAVICTKWGPPDVLQLQEVDKPTPKDNEVLIKVYATTVIAGDCELRRLQFPFLLRVIMRIGFGFRGPRKKILGQELAGEIESVGKDVTRFKAGDQVFASTGFGFGAYAQYKCLREEGGTGVVVALKPANMTYEEAAAIPFGGLIALHFLKQANIQNGQKVLINGAGGSIGTAAIQLAKYYGSEVTGVDSTGKLDMLNSIGADHVIDYTFEDFTESGATYDVIFDVIGKSSFSACKSSLTEEGFYLSANPPMKQMLRPSRTPKTSGKKAIIGGDVSYKTEDLNFLKELAEAGYIKPVIDRRYPLEKTAEAHAYVDTGQKAGNVVITID